MTKFEDQLYADLIQEYGSALAHPRPPVASRRHLTSCPALSADGRPGSPLVVAGGLPASAGGGKCLRGREPGGANGGQQPGEGTDEQRGG
jgi:hypothetical protein